MNAFAYLPAPRDEVLPQDAHGVRPAVRIVVVDLAAGVEMSSVTTFHSHV